MKKVYFAGSIRGGRTDAALYERMIGYIQRTDRVLTEHVGKPEYTEMDYSVRACAMRTVPMITDQCAKRRSI